jgi:putative transposase
MLSERDKRHRFPVETISHGVWVYYRFRLSYRGVEDLLLARGVTVTYEAIGQWCRKFGQHSVNQLRHRCPKPSDKKAAKKFFRKRLMGLTYVLRVIITDQLASHGAAKWEMLPSVEHRQHRYLNNGAENSQQSTRQREHRMQGCKSPGHTQRFLAACGLIAQPFRLRRHRLSASAYHQEMRQRFDTWGEIIGPPTVA